MDKNEIIAYLNANVHKIAKFEVSNSMIIIHFVNGDQVDITESDFGSGLDLGFERGK